MIINFVKVNFCRLHNIADVQLNPHNKYGTLFMMKKKSSTIKREWS